MLFFTYRKRIVMLIISYEDTKLKKRLLCSWFPVITPYGLFQDGNETAAIPAKTGQNEGRQRGKKGNFRREKREIREIARQPPVEHWILNRLDPEGCYNNTGDNNNQRSQYHVIHDFTLRFPLMSERNAPF